MKKQHWLAMLAAGMIFGMTSIAGAAEYSVDPAHTSVGFAVKHMFSKTTGEFKDKEGTFTFDPQKLGAAKVRFSAKADSIYTNNEKRDGHLKSPDFFDTAKYKELVFVGKKLTAAGDNKYKLEGDLTMHGVTKPVTFDVEYLGEGKSPFGDVRAGFTAITKVNRKDFGLTWNKALDNGGLLIGEDVEVKLEIEGVQKK
jgi:polyisoprenoid-binding protein YceI